MHKFSNCIPHLQHQKFTFTVHYNNLQLSLYLSHDLHQRVNETTNILGRGRSKRKRRCRVTRPRRTYLAKNDVPRDDSRLLGRRRWNVRARTSSREKRRGSYAASMTMPISTTTEMETVQGIIVYKYSNSLGQGRRWLRRMILDDVGFAATVLTSSSGSTRADWTPALR